MTFPREKRVLLGWLALLAPLPLPFNDVLEWPALFLYLVALIHFLGRAEDPTRGWLDNRALNGLGLVYLPILAVDTWQGAQRGQLVTPLLHLALFVLVVKLYSVRQEKEKWHVILAVFFVFVASMATSSHVTVVFYLLAAVALGLFALARLAELHMLAALGLSSDADQDPPTPVPARRPALAWRRRRGALWGVVAVVLLAAPIFAALPRLAQPFLTGRGAGNLGLSRVSGFSDEVSLDFTGEIRTRREIAMRLRFSYPVTAPEEMRFKGAAYDNYRDRRWFRDSDLFEEVRPTEGRFELGGGPEIANAIVYLEPLSSNSVIVPSEAVHVSFPGGPSRLYTDGGGGVVMRSAGQRSEILEYQVGLGEKPNLRGKVGPTPGGSPAGLDVSAVSPRIAELARRVMGEGSSEEKILRTERFLLSEYSYTLDISDEGGDPIEDFLFVSKAGHCEYFATAMVLMLRSEGIPARFVSGFLGAEPNAIEDLHVVRQSNAHAWVEAYAAETGTWEIHDPTPPAGRPGVAQGGIALLARQLYEFVAFRWDRYVLTYGAEDQGNLREKVAGFFKDAWQRLRSWLGIADEEAVRPGQGEGAPTEVAGEAGPAASAESRFGWLSAGLVAMLLAAAALLFWRRRPTTATAFYLALRRLLEAAELGVTAATPPLELRERLGGLLPANQTEVERLVALYLEEGFAGRQLEKAEREELRGLHHALEKALRRRLAERRKESRKKAGPAAAKTSQPA